MAEAPKGAGRHPPDHHGFQTLPMIESGGEVDEVGLPDRGRIVIERIGVTVEGTTATIVFAIAVTGTVGSAAVAARPGGLAPGLCSMGAIMALICICFRTGRPRSLRYRGGSPARAPKTIRRPTRRRSGRARAGDANGSRDQASTTTGMTMGLRRNVR